MKRMLLTGIIMLSSLAIFAQTDTTGKPSTEDTVFVGNFIIIRNNKDRNTYNDSLPPRRGDYTIINIPKKSVYVHAPRPNRFISTNYLIFDLGFANYNDKTVYGSPEAANFAEDGIDKHDLKPITGKSSNVNIWLFMQKLNLTKHVLNLKYGLGLSMYNYRYSSNISFQEQAPYIIMDTVDFSKNKLYAGYATVPFMLNVNPFTSRRHGLNFSAGVSAGYRIFTHTKQISDERGKVKNHDGFDLNDWMFAYVAEIGLGPVRVYGSYSINTLFEDAKHYPYTIGLRFSNW
ncbi:hypothetical protein [Parafilimonas sp.]|uniref:hypothetical protein n=1 Tax=Parafilimonas sp. TaxID=1969739 RepID=UPI0039E5B36B